MAALVAGHPRLHLTISLTPVLLWQLEDYLARRGQRRVLVVCRRSGVGKRLRVRRLFRTHLRNVYLAWGAEPPAALSPHIVPRPVISAFARPVAIGAADRIVVRMNCPGELERRIDDGAVQTARLLPVGGVMAGARRDQLTLGPFTARSREPRFRFHCREPRCDRQSRRCRGRSTGRYQKFSICPSTAAHTAYRDESAS